MGNLNRKIKPKPIEFHLDIQLVNQLSIPLRNKLNSQLSSKFHWRLYSEVKSGVKNQMEHGKFE
jgi:hypothetical protein